MIVYRIVRTKYLGTPLSGEGAFRSGGRWNPAGFPILYTSATPELALLEVVVHINPLDKTPILSWIVLEVPEPGQVVKVENLDAQWYDPLAYRSTQEILINWLENPDCVCVQVPSAIVPISANYLLHTGHPSFSSKVHVLDIVPCRLDSRLKRV